MRTKFLIAFLLLAALRLSGQARKHVGDTVPDFQFSNVVNASKKALALSDFKSEVLLLDFWSTGCMSCIEAMPKLAKLKKKYAGAVDVLIITYDDRPTLEAFLARRKLIADLGLPMVQRTAEWQAWFPHRTWPQVVWLGNDRTVKAITDGREVTDANIEKLLKDGSIDLPVKNDRLEPIDYHAPFLQPNFDMSIISTSSLLKGIPGVSSTSGHVKLDSNHIRIRAVNSNLQNLYAMAYRYEVPLHFGNLKSRMRFHLRDSSMVQKDSDGLNRSFCYELIVESRKTSDEKSIYQLMQKDLDRLFGLESKVVNKKTEALVLCSIPAAASGQKLEQTSLEENKYANASPSNLVFAIELLLEGEPPVLHRLPVKGKYSLVLKDRYASVEDLNRDLRPYGLVLTKEQVEVPILEIGN